MAVEPLILEGEIHNHADYPHTRWFIGNVDLDKILDELSFQGVRITFEPMSVAPVHVHMCDKCGHSWDEFDCSVTKDGSDGRCLSFIPKMTVTQRLLADLFKMLPKGPIATKSAWHRRRGL